MNKWIKGKKLSEETKRKISKALKGIEVSEITRAKRSKTLKGRKAPWSKPPHYTGAKNPNWKGGKLIDTNGYILIHCPNHPFCDKRKYILEHRLVMEKHLRRYLKPKEIVHHKGIKYPLGSIENKQDNRIENLKLFENFVKHFAFHKSL